MVTITRAKLTSMSSPTTRPTTTLKITRTTEKVKRPPPKKWTWFSKSSNT
jgi:hypothetical protein